MSTFEKILAHLEALDEWVEGQFYEVVDCEAERYIYIFGGPCEEGTYLEFDEEGELIK